MTSKNGATLTQLTFAQRYALTDIGGRINTLQQQIIRLQAQSNEVLRECGLDHLKHYELNQDGNLVLIEGAPAGEDREPILQRDSKSEG
jgi:hypothetical protein